MDYLFSKHLIVRRPVKNPDDYTEDIQSFLNDPHFLAAVYLASPAFHSTLKKQQFLIEKLTEREANTLRKYINRYCFRPTPFGLFATVSLTQWATGPGPPDERPPVFQPHLYTDQNYQAIMGQELLETELKKEARFEGNPSLYRTLNEYRFFRTALVEAFKEREYLLQSIAFSKLLQELITWCSGGRTLPDIIGHIRIAAACSVAEAREYAEFLVDAQVLLNRLRPNISGPDYLTRLLAWPKLRISRRSRRLSSLLRSLSPTALTPDGIQELNERLKAFLPEQPTGMQTDQLNVILQRNPPEAGPGVYNQSIPRDGIFALNALSPEDRLPAMDRFISAFQQHFEGQSLPLLSALDPETGIGYQQDTPENNNPLLETLQIPHRTKSEKSREWTAAQGLLLKSWLRANQHPVPVIQLLEEELQQLQLPDDQQLLGMSVLFRICDGKILVETAGGSNAIALIGRFTVVDEAIGTAARVMSAQVERQNPQLIFAELLHLADPHTDNVNRRQNTYTYELPLTAVSTAPQEHQLELADLYIRIVQNKAVLFSKKYGKPVIPRLSSAYNHSINKLPLFRFLADLPYQYGRFNLSLDLRQYFPDQLFYPRIEYRGTILSLATWVLSAKELEGLQREEPMQVIRAFEQLSENIHLSITFSLAEGDQQLVFNQRHEHEILFFCKTIRQKKEIILREFLPQPVVRQFNTYLLPAQPLVFPLAESGKPDQQTSAKRKYMPGSEWLYLKIYTPRAGASRLLLLLQSILAKRYSHGKISKWFFIRYDDHAPHIRFRMKVAPEDISEVLMAFKTKLEDRIQQHVVREYQLDVYSRELERYAGGGIERTEDFFWASSELVLKFLKKARHGMSSTAHHFALYTTQVIINEFIPGQEDQLVFMLESYQLFLAEFAEGKVKVALDKKYRELSAAIQAAMTSTDAALGSGSVKSGERFVRVLKKIQQYLVPEQEKRLAYIRSIIHMHLNRVFTDEPRKQEMITYYLLYKYQLSVKERNSN